MEISRRTFFKIGIAGGTGVAIAGASTLIPGGVKTVDWMVERNIHRDLPEEWMESVCDSCAATCPILLRKVGGNIVGVRPMAPKPCGKAYVIPQELYHPDRITSPLLNGTSVSKEAAISELTGMIRNAGAKTVLVVREHQGLSSALLRALGVSIGISAVATVGNPLREGPVDALRLATGWDEWHCRLTSAKGIVSFGWDWLQSFPNPVEAQAAFAELRKNDVGFIAVGPRLDLTAMKSRMWIPCKPGYEPLAARAIAATLIRDKQYDKLCESMGGFADIVQSLKGFDPAAWEEKCGIPAKKLLALSRVVAEKKPLCLTGRGRVEDQWQVLLLNALLGHFGESGAFRPLPEVSLPLNASGRVSSAEDIPEMIARGGNIETVILAGVNPVFESPAPIRWRDALKKVKNVVCLSSFNNETTALANLTLPIALPAESFEIYVEGGEGGVKQRRVDPVVTPSGELFSTAEVLFELAKRLNAPLGWKNLPDAASAITVRQPPSISLDLRKGTTWKAPEFSKGDFHLLLETPALIHGIGGPVHPYLLTTVAPHLREWWTTYVEINPKTAERLGLHERDAVIVENENGATIRAMARFFSGVPEDAVCLPLGLGHVCGTFAQTDGGNPAELISLRRDEGSAVPLWNLQKVNLRKA